ncbi:hypothetical protein [Aliikangiella sp. IMCC44359]|uniref:hypothetical protein n=1 Tax=Aliikangiella sp. IMCC44359 TaxID=3459125 RepID=UPI00403A90F8
MEKIAIIVYGDAGELGSFKIFSDNLKEELSKKYKKVIVQHVNRDIAFFNLIKSVGAKEEIAELHIFSHSIGAGIFLGYKDTSIASNRIALWRMAEKNRRKVTYHEVVRTETGAIQTDDFVSGALIKQKALLQKKFSKKSFIKIWGCNSGIDGWVYSDNGVVDPKDNSEAYYWRAFNEFNKPKPSIAKAFAKFFNLKVYGAKSGASIEVQFNKKWISSQQYKDKIGHWPSGSLPHRLVPDKGSYYEYLP